MSWLDAFKKIINTVQVAAMPLVQRPTLNFVAGVTAVDNVANNSTDLTVTAALPLLVNVKSYGAIGNGIANDTAAFAAAIAAVLAGPVGGAVYAPAGTYNLSSELVISTISPVALRLFGEGRATTLNFIGGQVVGLAANTTYRVELDHLHFTGSCSIVALFAGQSTTANRGPCWVHDCFFDSVFTDTQGGTSILAGVEFGNNGIDGGYVYDNIFSGNGAKSTFLYQGAVKATGTSPPAAQFQCVNQGSEAGTSTGILVEVTTGGALGTMVWKYSLNGGSSFVTSQTTTGGTFFYPLGSSGFQVYFPAGTYTNDNVYTGSVLAFGTTPPALWLTGSPSGSVTTGIVIEITTGGTLASGNVRFQWSMNGGSTWTTGVVGAASVALTGSGYTVNFAAGTYATDNVYTANFYAAVFGYAVTSVEFESHTNLHIYRNRISSSWCPYGIGLFDASQSSVDSNFIDGGGQYNIGNLASIGADNGYGVYIYCPSSTGQSNRVSNNTIQNTSDKGIYLQNTANTACVGNVCVNNALSYGSGLAFTSLLIGGICADVSQVAISGNVVKGSGASGIEVEGVGSAITGNRLDTCAAAGVTLNGACSFDAVVGNQISGCARGIFVSPGTGNQSSHLTIVGNSISGSTFIPIDVTLCIQSVIAHNVIDGSGGGLNGINIETSACTQISITDNVITGVGYAPAISNNGVQCTIARNTIGPALIAIAEGGIYSTGAGCSIQGNDLSAYNFNGASVGVNNTGNSCDVSDNDCSGPNGTSSIGVTSTGTYCTIRRNKVYNAASPLTVSGTGTVPDSNWTTSTALTGGPTVTGSKALNAALTSLMTGLAGRGLVVDSTS